MSVVCVHTRQEPDKGAVWQTLACLLAGSLLNAKCYKKEDVMIPSKPLMVLHEVFATYNSRLNIGYIGKRRDKSPGEYREP